MALWARLKGFGFPLSWAPWRLAALVRREVGLSEERSERVVEEYRRFLYLAAIAGDVAPSPLIAEVWRKHQADRRAYVEDLSRPLIGCLIDQDEDGPPPVHDPAYARTLALYRAEFGEEPFPAVWPDAQALRWQRRVLAAIVCGFAGCFLSLPVARIGEGAAGLLFLGSFAMALGGSIWLHVEGPWGATRPGD